MKPFAAYVGAAALVLVAVMVAAPTSLAAEEQVPQAVETPQQDPQTPPASPATGHAMHMQMMNQSGADQPAMGQMMGQGQMMGRGRMMGTNVNVDELLNAVKSATGDAKIDALADLIVGLFSGSQGMMGAGGMGLGGGTGMGGMMNMMNMMGGGMMHADAQGSASCAHQGVSGGGATAPRSPQPKG